ncbi:hypothetical protein B484DRAFT_412334, partial [Ochromonadaceae sp. CCMP2298]
AVKIGEHRLTRGDMRQFNVGEALSLSRIAYADPSAVGSLVDGNGALLPEAAQHLASFQIPDVYALCIPIYPSSGDSLELLVFMVDDKKVSRVFRLCLCSAAKFCVVLLPN